MRVVRAAGWAALAFAIVVAAGQVLPVLPTYPDAQLDNSFAGVLNHAASQPLEQRPRLISTYGPLGFSAHALYVPETYARVFALRAVLAAVLFWALAWMGWVGWGSPWGGALVLLVVTPMLITPDATAFAFVGLLPLLELAPVRPPPALRVAVGVALGLVALIKVTFVTAAAMVLAPLVVAALIARRPPLTALAAVFTVAGYWLWSGLGWAAWVDYLGWSLRDITPGYTAAMQVHARTVSLVEQAVAVSAVLLGWVTAVAWRRGRVGWWAVPIAYAGVLLLQFKAGFVRADVHVYTTAAALLMQGVMLAALLGSRPRMIAVALVLIAALPGAFLWNTIRQVSPARYALPRDIALAVRRMPAAVSGIELRAALASRLRDLRGMMAMPPFDGGVDMFGHWQNLLLANNAPYRPRPVFHGYMAYTPRLARENAAFLESPAAPRWLLFDTETIDGRLPSMDDAASWPILLSAYQPTGQVNRYALLERRPTPRPWRLVPLGSADGITDNAIPVPPTTGGPIWARIEVDLTLGERLLAAVFQAPYEHVYIVFVTSAVWRARLVPAIASDGFLLSPVIGSVPEFVALSTEGPQALPNKAVHEIRVHLESPFRTTPPARPVHVEFARLEIE